MAETNRIEWLDVARGLAIFFVIFGHASIGPQWLLLYAIPLFYMAMFFFVSGYLFKEKSSFSVVFEQRTRTLLLPYLFWGVVAIFIGHAFGNPPISIIDDFLCLLLLYGDILRNWFVGALWANSLLFYVIIRLSKGNNIALWGGAIVLFICGCLYLYHFNGPKLPYCLQNSLCAMAFMSLGVFYKNKEKTIDSLLSIKVIIPLFIAFVFAVSFFRKDVEYYGCAEIYPSILIYVLGIPIAIYISKHWTKFNRAILFLGRNSLLFFIFHFQIGTVVGKIFSHIDEDLLLLSPTFFTMIKTFVIILLATFPVLLINRFAPFLKGRGFKLFTSKTRL